MGVTVRYRRRSGCGGWIVAWLVQGGVEPLDEEEADFLLVVEDEVDKVAGVLGAEGPASDGAGGVVLVVGATVPRGELESSENLGEVGECIGGQCGDLVCTVVSGMMRYTLLVAEPLLDKGLEIDRCGVGVVAGALDVSALANTW